MAKQGSFGLGRALNVGAGIFVIAGVILLALYAAKRLNLGQAIGGIGGAIGIAPGGSTGSGAPIGGGQFGPTAGANTPSASGSIVPTSPGGTFATATLKTGPAAPAVATFGAPVRITSPLTVTSGGSLFGSAPSGAVISLVNGVPISLSSDALTRMGYAG